MGIRQRFCKIRNNEIQVLVEEKKLQVMCKNLEKVRALEPLIRGGGVGIISASKRDSRSFSIPAV